MSHPPVNTSAGAATGADSLAGPVIDGARPVLIAAGGTGGHVIPGLAVAEALKDRRVPVIWAGTAAGLEARLVPAAGLPLHLIKVRGLRGQSLLDTLSGPFRLIAAIVQSLRLLRARRVAAVLGMGGFVSGPVAIAALLLRIPLVLHEQNAVPGMTNAWLARFATRVFSAFPGAFANVRGHGRAVEIVGNPVPRAIIAKLDAGQGGGNGTDVDKPLNVLVIGGSRGAEFLNGIVPEAMALRASAGEDSAIRVVHQAGTGRADATRQRYASTGTDDDISVSDFIEDMAAAYHAADLVISRAGAMTVTELAASGTPALLVPYPHAVDDHQTANARWLVDAGAAVLLAQAGLAADRLAAEMNRLAADRVCLSAMARAACQLHVPGAAVRVAEALVSVSGQALQNTGPDTVRGTDPDLPADHRQPLQNPSLQRRAVNGGAG